MDTGQGIQQLEGKRSIKRRSQNFLRDVWRVGIVCFCLIEAGGQPARAEGMGSVTSFELKQGLELKLSLSPDNLTLLSLTSPYAFQNCQIGLNTSRDSWKSCCTACLRTERCVCARKDFSGSRIFFFPWSPIWGEKG